MKDKVYLVYEQRHIFDTSIVKIFKEEQDAKDYCEMQNQLNKPEYDDYGYAEGINHGYYTMEVE